MSDKNATVARFTSQELSYIVSSNPGEGSDLAWDRLNLPSESDRAAMAASGLASLFARDLVEVTDGKLEFTEVPALVGLVLTSDAHWIELSFVAPDQVDAGLLVRRDDVSLFLSPRLFGVFEVRLLEPSLSYDGLATIALGFLDGCSEGLVSAHQISAQTESSIAVRLLGDGTVQVSQGDGDELITVANGGDRYPIKRALADVFAR